MTFVSAEPRPPTQLVLVPLMVQYSNRPSMTYFPGGTDVKEPELSAFQNRVSVRVPPGAIVHGGLMQALSIVVPNTRAPFELNPTTISPKLIVTLVDPVLVMMESTVIRLPWG